MPTVWQMTALLYLKMKVERADLHLKAFNALLAAHLPKANTVTTKDDLEKGLCIRTTEFHPSPPAMGMELGEFLYSLRSGLDQTAWNLALREARKRTPKLICFPIVDEIINSADRRDYKRTMALFPTEVAEKIDSLQPYKRGNRFKDHPLWQLNVLCNIDKHCLIPIESRAASIFVPTGGEAFYRTDIDAIEVRVPLDKKHYFDHDPKNPPTIEIGEWESDLRMPLGCLADIYSFMADTVFPELLKVDRAIDFGDSPVKVGPEEPVFPR